MAQDKTALLNGRSLRLYTSMIAHHIFMRTGICFVQKFRSVLLLAGMIGALHLHSFSQAEVEHDFPAGKLYHKLFNQLGQKPLVRTMEAGEQFYIEAQQGTAVYIPANAFVDETGNPVTGEVEIRFTEYATKAQMLLSNLPTHSGGQIIETGGAIRIEAWQGDKKLRLADGKNLGVVFPGGEKEGMQLFAGDVSAENEVDWKPLAGTTLNEQRPEGARMEPFLEYGLVDPRNLVFADGVHALYRLIPAHCELHYFCNEDIKHVDWSVLMHLDEEGRVIKAECDTDAPCLKQAMEEVATSVVFDKSLLPQGRDKILMSSGNHIYARFHGPQELSNVFVSRIPGSPVPQEAATYIARIREEERLKAEQQEKQAEVATMDKLYSKSFAVSELGYINCDRFYQTAGEKKDMFAAVNNPEGVSAKTFLVFKEINSVMPGMETGGGKVTFDDVPVGMKASLVVVGYSLERGAFFTAAEVVTGGETISLPPLRQVTEQELVEAVSLL